MTEIDRLPRRVRQPAIVEYLQEEVPGVGVRLFELVEEHDRERLLPHLVGQRLAVGLLIGLAEDLPRRLHGLELAHVEPDEPIGRAEEKLREGLCQLGLSRAGGACEQEHGDRPARIGEAGFEHGNPVDDDVDRLVLADDACGKVAPDGGELDPLPIVEHELRHAGELGQRGENVLAIIDVPSWADTRCAVSLMRSSAVPGICPVPR